MIFRHIKAKVARNKISLFWNVFRIYSVSGLDAVAPDDLAVPAPPFLVSYRPFCSGPPLHQHKTQNLQNIVLIFSQWQKKVFLKPSYIYWSWEYLIDIIYCPMSTTMQHVGPPLVLFFFQRFNIYVFNLNVLSFSSEIKQFSGLQTEFLLGALHFS